MSPTESRPSILQPIRILDSGFWILDSERWSLDSWIPGFWIPGFLDFGGWRVWIPGFLDSGFMDSWILSKCATCHTHAREQNLSKGGGIQIERFAVDLDSGFWILDS